MALGLMFATPAAAGELTNRARVLLLSVDDDHRGDAPEAQPMPTPAAADSELPEAPGLPLQAGPSLDAGSTDARAGPDATPADARGAAPDSSEELPALDDGGDCTCRVGGANDGDPPYDMAAAGILFFAGLLFRRKK